MNKRIALVIIAAATNLFAGDLVGIDYGYIPVQTVNRTGTEEQIHDLNQISSVRLTWSRFFVSQ
jgi:hypothetical protein